MPHMPTLRVVPLERIRRHEEIDPLRVERLVGRLTAEGIQVNPMVCCVAPSGELVLLDGATRTEALKRIGLPHAVVQIVEPGDVTLETWHHVVRGCETSELLAAVAASSELNLAEATGTPRLHLSDGESKLVEGLGVTANATLSALVKGYIGTWDVSRAIDPRVDSVAWTFPDWAAVAEFPRLTIEDVMTAAVTDDLLPAGITRFLVPDRALRLNVDLDLLASDSMADEKQARVDALIEERAREGRVRRYEETVFILDD